MCKSEVLTELEKISDHRKVYTLSLEGVMVGEGDLNSQIDLSFLDYTLRTPSIPLILSVKFRLKSLRDYGLTRFIIDPYPRSLGAHITTEMREDNRLLSEMLLLFEKSRVYTASKEIIEKRKEELNDMGICIVDLHQSHFSRSFTKKSIENGKPFVGILIEDSLAKIIPIDTINTDI